MSKRMSSAKDRGIYDDYNNRSTSCSTEKPADGNRDTPEVNASMNYTNVEAAWFNENIINVLANINTDYSNTCKRLEDVRNSFTKSVEIFNKLNNVVNKLSTSTTKTTSHNEGKNTEIQIEELGDNKGDKTNENNDHDDEEDDISSSSEDSDDNEDSDYIVDNDSTEEEEEDSNNENDKYKTPKRARKHDSSFILPPEYDANDARWTLRHRNNHSEPGLTELVPNSGVFVNAIKLAYCKLAAKDCNSLARMLLLETYSDNALRVCSLLGAKCYTDLEKRSKSARPVLDQNAKIILLSFIKEHSRLKGWSQFDHHNVISAMTNKIQEMRIKYLKEK
ncbi:protein PFC0760c-like [Achroia grisella]|uniref:protein PFC0760c-like n=1 Tax=Achroia grisella TaxID=688607 RepID=UPI0027D21DFF|nr:protein PFC0760c-like [Achroia grisella]